MENGDKLAMRLPVGACALGLKAAVFAPVLKWLRICQHFQPNSRTFLLSSHWCEPAWVQEVLHMLQALFQSSRSRRRARGFLIQILEVMTGDKIGEVRRRRSSTKVGGRYYLCGLGQLRNNTSIKDVFHN